MSHPPARRRLTAAVLLISWVVAVAASASEVPSPITYREFTAEGPAEHRTDGRLLRPSAGGAVYGIDILSRVAVEIDEAALAGALEIDDDPRTYQLRQRARRLLDATAKVRSRTQAARDAFAAAKASGDWGAARAAITAMGAEVGAIFNDLEKIIQQRIVAEQGLDETAALGAAERLFEPVYEDLAAGELYNYEALGELLARELEAFYEAYGRHEPASLEIEIQAHRLAAQGEPTPIFLPGYNTVATGPLRSSSKLRFGVPESERELHDAYTELAAEIEATQDLGAALRASLEAELTLLRRDFEAAARQFRAELEASRSAIEDLARWADRDQLEDWLEGLRDELEASAADEVGRLEALLDDLTAQAEEVTAIVDQLGELVDAVEGIDDAASVESAIETLLAQLDNLSEGRRELRELLSPEAWRARLEELTAVLDAARELPAAARQLLRNEPSPIVDFERARDAVESLWRTAEALGPEVLARLRTQLGFGREGRVAGELPTPPGQKRIALDREADTEFDLRTVREELTENDQVQVGICFFHDDTLLECRQDRFRLREFGLSSRVFASLAFTRPAEGEDREWEPAPAMSWILHTRRWPKGDDAGLSGPGFHRFGFGISTMTLDQVDDESVELGLAASIAVFDDRIVLGYGHNLQADENEAFWFFSIRLLKINAPF